MITRGASREEGSMKVVSSSLTSRRLCCWASCLLAVCSGNYYELFFISLRLTQRSAGYAEAQFRQYQRLTKQIRPDMEGYEKQREVWWVTPAGFCCILKKKNFTQIDGRLNIHE